MASSIGCQQMAGNSRESENIIKEVVWPPPGAAYTMCPPTACNNPFS